MELWLFIRDICTAILIITGGGFMILGTVGLLRLPDAYTRLHPATICDTLGGGLIIFAMVIYGGLSPNILRLLVILFLLYTSSAVNGHAIGRAIYKEQTKFKPGLNVVNNRKAKENLPAG
jgi:multicomponent Na+:H+ antiporter subunit G